MPNALVQMQLATRQIANGRKRVRLKKPPKWLYPSGIERQYRSSITKFISNLHLIVKQRLIPRLPSLIESAELARPTTDSIRSDSWSDELARIIQEIKLVLAEFPKEVEALTSDIATLISNWNNTQFHKTVSQVYGVDIFVPEPWLLDEVKAFARQNSMLISTLSYQSLDQIDGIVTRGLQQGLRVEVIASQIAHQIDVSEKRAKFIARDQTAKLNGQLTKLRQQSIGVSKYIWSTARDERVRPSHRARNGKVFSWDKPPEGGPPGNEYLCRCNATAIFEEI